MLVFGASGDLTKRLLVPALYNLECDGLLHENFALLGTALDPMNTEQFRAKMNEDIKKFHTRNEFDQAKWDKLVSRFHYVPCSFTQTWTAVREAQRSRWSGFRPAVQDWRQRPVLLRRGAALLRDDLPEPARFGLAEEARGGNASSSKSRSAPTSPRHFSSIRTCWPNGMKTRSIASTITWARKPCRTCWRSASATASSSRCGTRITSTTFSSTSPRPSMSSKDAADITTRRARRYMMQNHMFQMLAYLCMESPGSFQSDAIRNEKAKLLQAVRVYTPEEVAKFVVRGQYGPHVGRRAGKTSNPATAV